MSTPPLVSVIMANCNGAAHIAAAVRSVLRQTLGALELIVSDDGSSDDSLALARAAAGGDARLLVLTHPVQTGPAAARNRALKAASGRWIAIVDNDDLIRPERLQRLVDAAERDRADIAADDLITFYEDSARKAHAHLGWTAPRWIRPAAYETSNRMLGAGPSLGYLKPIFRASLGAAYNESLRIGEDSDLVLRLLMRGARMRVYPELGYFYRKHGGSLSHRLSAAPLEALQAAYAAHDAGADAALGAAFAAQRAALKDARAFVALTAAIKAKDAPAALRTALQRPGALLLLRDAIGARLLPKRKPPALPGPRITLLSRQRIVGATNGSSAYVLALAGALKSAGFHVDYLGVSPKIFGRWAVLRLKPEIATFDRYLVHGGLRIGDIVLARDPRVWVASAVAVMEHAFRKLGVGVTWSRAAEYAQGAAPTRADQLFAARHAAPEAVGVLCDYAYLAPMAAYALADAPSAIIMHDLISARVADPQEAATQKVAVMNPAEEFALLGMADAVIAIQPEEAKQVANALPARRVLLAPHGARTSSAAQPGEDDRLLFVGSNTAPNIVGLRWFFEHVWPLVRLKRPDIRLSVAGSVARALEQAPEGVAMLGVVGDLAPLYANAGVVISPLYTGSGLKIKLIEALAEGKAVIGTTITAQGVERIVADAMVIADTPEAFAQAIADVAGDRVRREALGQAALSCAERHFSVAAAFSPVIDYLQGDDGGRRRNSLQEAAAAAQ
jgi:GT2 family glycosyltransferase/glycosyltransferase involved in cell wall biosynthesis